MFCTRALMCALMTQKSCAVGMRNAKLGNHLKRRDKSVGNITPKQFVEFWW